MSSVAISARNIGISYRKRLSFRHQEANAVLSDVTFDLLKGETLGVVGRNGAGKSTLLRLLAGVLAPDKGTLTTNITNVSLLSLNLGLDPHLSGLDNAILSGLLLGLSQSEAEKNLSEIIDFSELGGAIYNPIKTYSFGMLTRLGFSIAIHLKPDVLLIDEVLGVGDAEFQVKSHQALKGKINSEQTVVLVSHNSDQVRALCDRAIWIENGKSMLIGDTNLVMEQYEAYILDSDQEK